MGTIDMAALVRTHLKPLVLFARQWDEAAAEDIVHDAFVRLAGQVRDGRTPNHVTAWLYRVVRNMSIDRHRRHQQTQKHAESVARETTEWFVTHEKNEDRLDALLLTERMKTLPLEQREVIVAHLWGDRSFREIAALTGRSFSTVRREFHQGLETLRAGLIPDD